MLRIATGFALANKGVGTRASQTYLGLKNIQHTVRYTELSATRCVPTGFLAIPVPGPSSLALLGVGFARLGFVGHWRVRGTKPT